MFRFENVQLEWTINLLFPETYLRFLATFEWSGLIVRKQRVWLPSTTSSFEVKLKKLNPLAEGYEHYRFLLIQCI